MLSVRFSCARSFGFLSLVVISLSTLASAQAGPDTVDDLVSRAAEARNLNDVPGAIALYQQIVQLKPEWPEGWWFLGVLQYGSGAYSAGRETLSHLLALAPDSGLGFGVRGLCEFETGDYSQSFRDIQQALALGAGNDPRYESIFRFHQLLLLTLNGDFETALREYSGFARGGTASPEILLGIGLAGLRMAVRPRDLDPKQRDLVSAAGKAAFQFMAGNPQNARQQFADLFQQYPAAANVHYLYGYLLFATDPDQAIGEFKRELEVAPSNAAARVMLAWYFILRNNAYEALPYAEAAVTVSPASPSAQLVLGRSLAETGDVKDAMPHLETALKLDPDNLEIHLALVKEYSESGRKADAMRERLQCIGMTRGETGAVVGP